VEAFAEWFQQFYESTGWNFVFMYDEYERDRLVEAIWVTIKLSLNCLLFSLIVGVVGAWAQGARVAWVRHTVYWYIQAFRNTPPLVQILFFYFVIGNLLPTYDAGGSLRHRGRSDRHHRGRRVPRLQSAESIYLHRNAAGISRQPAGTQQQSR
jgi:His/Glu/Gln/Arg/opine family amino acid ABC transporter permease subunit